LPAVLLVLPACLLPGCGTADGSVDDARARVTPPAAPPQTAAATELRETRILEEDSNADGIVDYRCTLTETFDLSGNIETRIIEQDFDADGIADSRISILAPGPADQSC
jgi:hypothetical protein